MLAIGVLNISKVAVTGGLGLKTHNCGQPDPAPTFLPSFLVRLLSISYFSGCLQVFAMPKQNKQKESTREQKKCMEKSSAYRYLQRLYKIRKEGRKEGWGGVWLPTIVGLKSQSSWQNRGGGGGGGG